MTVLAAEAAPEAQAVAASAGLSSGAAAQPPPAPGKGAVLAIAIVLLWLAAFCFFIAFEGATLLQHDAHLNGAEMIGQIVTQLRDAATRTPAG